MSKGSQLVSRAEAARMLGTSMQAVSYLTRMGTLRAMPAPRGHGRFTWFALEDVLAVRGAKKKTVGSRTSALAVARQAHAVACTTRTRLDRLCAVLGLDIPAASTEPHELEYAAWMARGLASRTVQELSTIREWTDLLFGVCESWMAAVVAHTQDPELPMVFLNATNRILLEREPTDDPAHLFAYDRLDGARERLRGVVFVYVYTAHGKRRAFSVMPGGILEDVRRALRLLPPG